MVSTGRSNGTHFKGVDVCFEGAISGAPDFNPRRFGVTRFVPLQFFLWGYLKARVYVNRPQSLDDLKDNIRQEIANIPGDMLVRVIENTRNRYMKCIDNEGGHLPDMIFKTV